MKFTNNQQTLLNHFENVVEAIKIVDEYVKNFDGPEREITELIESDEFDKLGDRMENASPNIDKFL